MATSEITIFCNLPVRPRSPLWGEPNSSSICTSPMDVTQTDDLASSIIHPQPPSEQYMVSERHDALLSCHQSRVIENTTSELPLNNQAPINEAPRDQVSQQRNYSQNPNTTPSLEVPPQLQSFYKSRLKTIKEEPHLEDKWPVSVAPQKEGIISKKRNLMISGGNTRQSSYFDME